MNNLEGWLLMRLNEWVAETPAAFYQALGLVDRIPWLLAAGVITALWFGGEPGIFPTEPGRLTRLESRRRVLLMLVAMVVSFLLVHAFQLTIFHLRPLVNMPLQAPIEPGVWQTLRDRLAGQSGFPSYQVALLFGLATGMFSFNKGAGCLAGLVGGYLGALQVGLGFCWPGDVLAGALMGVLVTSLTLASEPLWRRLLTPLALQFEYHQALSYTLAFLLLIDISQKFTGLAGLVEILVYALNA